MNITLIGVIIIAMTIYAFFKNEKLLLYMLVFFSTFTAAELFHIDMLNAPVLPFEFIGMFWLLREFINFIKSKPKIKKEEILNKFKENKFACACIIFIICVILGEVYFAISGLHIEYTAFDGTYKILTFSMSNINQCIIITFIFVLMIVMSFKIKTKEEIHKLLKIFCISSIFAIIWGLFQFVTYYLGIKYPAFLFNNNIYAGQGYDQLMTNNIKRISSIALEASTFAVNLISVIPFFIVYFLQLNRNLKDRKYILTFILVIMSTVCAILTTSSTAIIGLIVIYGIIGIYFIFGCKNSEKMLKRRDVFLKMAEITILAILITVGLSFVCVKIGYRLGKIQYIEATVQNESENKEVEKKDPDQVDKKEYESAFGNIISTLKQMTIDKMASYSGQERSTGEKTGISMFKYSPVFGIGFGAYRPFSLFTNILISTGIIRNRSFWIYFLYCFEKYNRL